MPLTCPCCQSELPEYSTIDEEKRLQLETSGAEAEESWRIWKQEQSRQWPLLRFFSNLNELSFFGFACLMLGIASVFAIRQWWPITWSDPSTAEGVGILLITSLYLLTLYSDWYLYKKMRASFEKKYPHHARLIE